MNGVPETSAHTALRNDREILFCARLQKRKRPTAFVEVAHVLAQRGVAATFALVGPDEGELAAVLQSIKAHKLEHIVRYEGALDYDEVLDRMSRAGVYVLPSVNEPFAMSLLEALSLGLPSLCTTSCGVADVLQQRRAAVVTGESTLEMADGVQRILEDEALRRELSANGRQAVAEVFSMVAVGDRLEQIYREASNSTFNFGAALEPE